MSRGTRKHGPVSVGGAATRKRAQAPAPTTDKEVLKQKQIKLILELLREGHFLRFACKAAGISHETWYRWQIKDPTLINKQEEAELVQVRTQLNKITHADDPKWAAWFMERKMPDWRAPQVQQIALQGDPKIVLTWPEDAPKKDE